MTRMDPEEFDDLVRGTNLGERSIQAARRVMVDGIKPVRVFEETGVHEQQISRTVKLLEKRQATKAASQQVMVDSPLAVSRALAVKQLRDLEGDNAEVKVPRSDELTMGQVLLRTDHHLVQAIGKGRFMLHELARLERVPAVGKSVTLQYRGGMAQLVDADRELTRSRGGRQR